VIQAVQHVMRGSRSHVLAGMPEADRHDEQQVHDLLDMLQLCGIGVSK